MWYGRGNFLGSVIAKARSLVGAWYGITGSQRSMEDASSRVQWLIQDAHFAFGEMNYEVSFIFCKESN